MSRLRVSAISYLNTAPLMWDFERGSHREELREQFEVDYTIPSRCAQMLADGSADIGIIPVAAYATVPGLRILSNVVIASRSAVRSILLVSQRPLDQIHSVALDSSSRSSAALIQILFAKHWNLDVHFATADPQIDMMLAGHDAALLIGDLALYVDRSRYLTWDLGEEWRSFTGKPFVFAFWAARLDVIPEHELAKISAVFSTSRDEGLKHIYELATVWATKLMLPQPQIIEYLSENIHYRMDEENIAGMRLFFRYAAELNILPTAPELPNLPEGETRNSLSASRI